MGTRLVAYSGTKVDGQSAGLACCAAAASALHQGKASPTHWLPALSQPLSQAGRGLVPSIITPTMKGMAHLQHAA